MPLSLYRFRPAPIVYFRLSRPLPPLACLPHRSRHLRLWRHRALTALQSALTDHRPGPQCPANRLPAAQEDPLVALAQRYPTWSAAQIYAQAGPEAPSHRTIQRLRHRYGLPCLPKRPAPCRPARRLTPQVKQEARRLIEAKHGLALI